MERPILIAELGRGGMADVFLAMRRGMGGFTKLVVIKRLREDAVEGDVVAMFHDEARIGARLNHPNVVQTYEAGFEDGHYRLELEYLDGQPLHRLLARAKKSNRAIPRTLAVAIVRNVLAGLHYAHELTDFDGTPLGIVHRDVSPQNIFVTYEGRVKLVDFGIAKAAGQVAVTQMGVVKGKIRYMAPEQAFGRRIDRRTDVFAAGIVLWQLLTGKSYWGDTPELDIYARLAKGDLPGGPRTVDPRIDEALDQVCLRALAADPAGRFASAEAFQLALEAAAPTQPGTEGAIAALTTQLFGDLRRAIRAEIEKAAARALEAPEEEPTQVIAQLQSQGLSGFQPKLDLSSSLVGSSARNPRPDLSQVTGRGRRPEHSQVTGPLQTSAPPVARTTRPTHPSDRSRTILELIAVPLGALLGAFAIALVVFSWDSPRPTAPRRAPPPETAPASARVRAASTERATGTTAPAKPTAVASSPSAAPDAGTSPRAPVRKTGNGSRR
jgi:eukaryotic-like serine/threonine-protein kinase